MTATTHRCALSDLFPPSTQRPRLLEFRQAIRARAASLRRDECGDWAISGRLGHVYALPEGFQLVVSTNERPKRWTSIKKRLAFCRITQDGGDEGCLILDRLPNRAEGEFIREAFGIRKAPALSDAAKAKLVLEISRVRAAKTTKCGAGTTGAPSQPFLTAGEP
jgi:hypothetical protein